MGVKQDVEETLKDYPITTIEGQPDEESLSKLKVELAEALASIPTLNGGGQHGHIGLIIPEAEYIAFSHNAERYEILDNPGPYPAQVDQNDAVLRERQVAEHKANIKEYEMQLGAVSWTRKAIIAAVDDEWVSEIKNEHVGFNHLLPIDIIAHLETVGGTLDFRDVTDLQAELLTPWDQVEAPTTLFERQDKIERQLIKAGIPAQTELRLMTARTWFEQSGEFDFALERWEALPAAQKTFTAFRVMIQKEFAKHNKRDKQTAKGAGRGLANNVSAEEEAQIHAMALAEVVNALTAQTNAQMDKMMEMFKEAMAGKSSSATPSAKETYPKCPHCSRRHPKPDECWELEKNSSKRPKNWVPVAERKKKADAKEKSE